MQGEFRKAFTTRLPLAVLIAMGVKKWENRSSLPNPSKGTCGMSVSKSSDENEYKNFIAFITKFASKELQDAVPSWEQVKNWRGKMIAVMDYEAGEESGDLIWNEGYRYWWKLDNVKMLDEPFPVRGNVGMWDFNRSDFKGERRRREAGDNDSFLKFPPLYSRSEN